MKHLGTAIITLLLFLHSFQGGGTIPGHALDSAFKEYEKERYDKAFFYFKKVEETHSSPFLFYDLGTTALRSGKTGEAVYYLQKAHKLAPFDKDIEHNLDIAKQKGKDEFDNQLAFGIQEQWEAILRSKPIGSWSVWAIVFSILSSVLMVLGLMTSLFSVVLTRLLSLVSGVIAILFFLLALWTHKSTHSNDMVVIMDPKVKVMSEPLDGASTSFVLHEGTTVNYRSQNDGWIEVRTPDGDVGWIPEGKGRVL